MSFTKQYPSSAFEGVPKPPPECVLCNTPRLSLTQFLLSGVSNNLREPGISKQSSPSPCILKGGVVFEV